MKRKFLESFIKEEYDIPPEFPWIKYPTFAVYRHGENKKWFAVIMDIPKSKLGILGDEEISVVNLKCDVMMIGSVRKEKGIFGGWHMNKNHWITVVLDGSVPLDKIKFLVDLSYELTKKQR